MSAGFQIPHTYQPVAAIVLFALIEVGLFQSGLAESIARVLLGGSWLLVLGAFMLVSWFASRISLTSESKGAQNAALGGADVLVRASAVHVERRLAGHRGRDFNGRISS